MQKPVKRKPNVIFNNKGTRIIQFSVCIIIIKLTNKVQKHGSATKKLTVTVKENYQK